MTDSTDYKDKERLYIIVADDDLATRRLTQRAISGMLNARYTGSAAAVDFEIIQAGSGHAAYQKIIEHAQAGVLHHTLLATDYKMEDMNAEELTKEIRKHKGDEFAKLPIVYFTGLMEDDLPVSVKNDKYSGLLFKPIDPLDMERAIYPFLDSIENSIKITTARREETPEIIEVALTAQAAIEEKINGNGHAGEMLERHRKVRAIKRQCDHEHAVTSDRAKYVDPFGYDYHDNYWPAFAKKRDEENNEKECAWRNKSGGAQYMINSVNGLKPEDPLERLIAERIKKTNISNERG